MPQAAEEARRAPVDPARVMCAVDLGETSPDTVKVALALARAGRRADYRAQRFREGNRRLVYLRAKSFGKIQPK